MFFQLHNSTCRVKAIKTRGSVTVFQWNLIYGHLIWILCNFHMSWYIIFVKFFFFFLIWAIFQVFVKFVITLLLFCYFGREASCILTSLTSNRTYTHRALEKYLYYSSFKFSFQSFKNINTNLSLFQPKFGPWALVGWAWLCRMDTTQLLDVCQIFMFTLYFISFSVLSFICWESLGK